MNTYQFSTLSELLIFQFDTEIYYVPEFLNNIRL